MGHLIWWGESDRWECTDCDLTTASDSVARGHNFSPGIVSQDQADAQVFYGQYNMPCAICRGGDVP